MEFSIIVILLWGNGYYERLFYNLLVVCAKVNLIDRDNNTIQGRLDAVQEILQTEDMFHSVAKCISLFWRLIVALKGFQDFDRLLTMVADSLED